MGSVEPPRADASHDSPAARRDVLDDRPLTEPRADRFDRSLPRAAQALAAHAAALEAAEMTYRDPVTGFRVLTAKALADRGTCCGLGCRHCPYLPR